MGQTKPFARRTVKASPYEKRVIAGRGLKRVDLANIEIASSEKAREHNRNIVLELIRSRQPVARADLSRLSGLQPSTVSSIVEQLLAEWWIVEGAAERRPRGRRPTMLSLNDGIVTLVADVRPRRAIIAVVDLNGRILAQLRTPISSDAERSITKIGDAMQTLKEQHGDKFFQGAGVSLPGRVNPETQRLILAPNLKWADYDVKGALEERLRLKVDLDNDATACLLSELWFGRMDGVKNAVLVSISEGLGTAILANGQLVYGHRGMAGEFGHISLDPAGVRCGCGQLGCWETLASSNAALRFYAELVPGAREGTIQDLLQLTEEGDASAIEAISKQAYFLGRGLHLITAGLAPEVILITGALTNYWQHFGHIVEKELRGNMLAGDPPRLEIASGGELARLRGAAAIVLQRHSGPTPAIHSAAARESGVLLNSAD